MEGGLLKRRMKSMKNMRMSWSDLKRWWACPPLSLDQSRVLNLPQPRSREDQAGNITAYVTEVVSYRIFKGNLQRGKHFPGMVWGACSERPGEEATGRMCEGGNIKMGPGRACEAPSPCSGPSLEDLAEALTCNFNCDSLCWKLSLEVLSSD